MNEHEKICVSKNGGLPDSSPGLPTRIDNFGRFVSSRLLQQVLWKAADCRLE